MELLLAMVIGVAVAVGSVVVALRLRPSRQGGGSGGRAANVDPFGVGEPWRQHVAAAQSAQRRFTAIVARMDEGPLRASMVRVGHQVTHSLDECWQIARHGDQLDHTIRQLDGASLQSRHDRATDATQRASLRSQLDSLERIRSARRQTDERLRTLQTRLGELVSQAAEVSTGVDHTAELGTAVDDIVTQLEALSLAVDEVNNTGRSRGFDTSGPGTAAPAT